MNSAPAVSLTNVSKSFEDGDYAVIDDCSIAIEEGSIVFIMGASGSGKTTLLNLIAGIEKPDCGSIQLSPDLVELTSYVFQSPSLLPWRSVAENLRLPFEIEGGNVSDDEISQVLEQVGLIDAATKRPHELSGGMRVRAALARALIIQPKLLLLDEPTSSQDYHTKRALSSLIVEYAKERRATVISVSHDLDECLEVADRAVVLARKVGKLSLDIDLSASRERDTSLSSVRQRFINALAG